MPNHVYSRLKLSGDAAQIEKFIEGTKVVEDNEAFNDFTRWFPTPPELVKVQCGSGANIVSEEEYKKALEGPEPPMGCGRPITQAMSIDYKRRFGYDNWYDWNCKNWGTKWGTYQGKPDPEKENEFTFQTAWSPATGLWLNISKQFPDVVFETEAVDEGGGFVVVEIYQNGEVTESTEHEWDSDEGIEIRQSVGQYNDEDEDDEDDDEENDIQALFDQFEDDYIQFEKVERKLSNRPDLHAFLLLDSLFPGDRDIVSAAEHDEIYLDIDAEELAKKATPEQIQELVRCGVRYDSDTGSLAMFA